MPNLRNKRGVNRRNTTLYRRSMTLWLQLEYNKVSDLEMLRRCKRMGLTRLCAWTCESLASDELGMSRKGVSMHVACSPGKAFNDFDKPEVRYRLRDADQRDQPCRRKWNPRTADLGRSPTCHPSLLPSYNWCTSTSI